MASQLCGGVVYRRCRSGPFDCLRLDRVAPPALYFRSFGPLSTSAVLGSAPLGASLAAAGSRTIAWLEEHLVGLTMDALLDRSLEFAEESGLLTDRVVRETIDRVRALGGHATMIMIGRSVLATLPDDDRASWTRCGVDRDGTRLLP